MNKNELVSLLTTKAKCPESKLEPLLSKIKPWDNDLKEALYKWLSDDVIPELSEGEYSVKRLMEEKDMKVIAALMTIDWLRRAPKMATETLKKGVDKIISK